MLLKIITIGSFVLKRNRNISLESIFITKILFVETVIFISYTYNFDAMVIFKTYLALLVKFGAI